MYISLGFPDNTKRVRISPRQDSAALLELKDLKMDGFTVAGEIIRKYGKRRRRPVISALTANCDTKTRERCYEVGMDYVLMKPINLELLRSELVKLQDLHDELDCPPQLSAAVMSSLLDSETGSSTDSSTEHSPAPQLHLPQAFSALHHNKAATTPNRSHKLSRS